MSVREGGVMLHARWVELPTTPTTGSSPETGPTLSLVARLEANKYNKKETSVKSRRSNIVSLSLK